jgi:hypothetical protein
MPNQALQQTAATILVLESSMSLSAAAAAELSRSAVEFFSGVATAWNAKSGRHVLLVSEKLPQLAFFRVFFLRL